MLDIENSRKTAEKGAEWVTIKQPKNSRSTRKTAVLTVFRVFRLFFRLFYCAPLGTLFRPTEAPDPEMAQNTFFLVNFRN